MSSRLEDKYSKNFMATIYDENLMASEGAGPKFKTKSLKISEQNILSSWFSTKKK